MDIDDISNTRYFTTDLDISSVPEALKRRSLYTSWMEDVCYHSEDADKYLEHVLSNITQFFMENEVWNRDELRASLERIVTGRGQFACLLGGRSTGKSLLLNELAGETIISFLWISEIIQVFSTELHRLYQIDMFSLQSLRRQVAWVCRR